MNLGTQYEVKAVNAVNIKMPLSGISIHLCLLTEYTNNSSLGSYFGPPRSGVLSYHNL